MTEAEAMVFVVDDDEGIRQSLQNLIGSVGLQVQVFASAQEFLRSKLRRRTLWTRVLPIHAASGSSKSFIWRALGFFR